MSKPLTRPSVTKKMNQKKRKWKQIGLLLSVFCLGTLLCACAEVRLKTAAIKDALIQVEDATLSYAEGVFLLMEEKAAYERGQDVNILWDQKAGELSLSDYVKDGVKDRLIRYAAAQVLSDRYAAYPTDEEKTKAGDDAVASWTKISALYDVSEYDITAETVRDLYDKEAVYNAVYEKITTDAAKDVNEDNTRVMLADYVVIPVENGEEAANKVREAVLSGGDFQKACEKEGLSLLAAQHIKRGDLPPDVDNISFALKDNEMSEVIESKNGFYLIRCLDDNLLDESAANYNEILANTKERAFQKAWLDFSSDAKLSIDDRFWNKLDLKTIK